MTNKFLIPGAIIVAGIVVGGAIFFSQRGNTTPTTQDDDSDTAQEIVINPITEDDHILGNPNAPIKIVEFSDLECPFCKTFHATLQSVIDEYGADGQVAWVYRHFPLAQLHPKAPQEAVATECAASLGGNDAFWAYTNRIFEITPSNNGLDLAILPDVAESIGLNREAFETCLESDEFNDAVQEDFNDAVAAGGTGTPHSVVILSEPMPASVQTAMSDIAAVVNTPQRPRSIVLSDDNTKIAVSGALPGEIIQQIIDAALFGFSA